MFLAKAETRFANDSHPRGGVAPTRHALARHTYLERQRGWATSNSAGLIKPSNWLGLSDSLARVILVFTRMGAFRSVARLMDKNPQNEVADSLKDAPTLAE